MASLDLHGYALSSQRSHKKSTTRTVIFFDGPGGTQVPQQVIEAMSDCLTRSNVLNLTERLGVESSGGMLRIGLVHYNTVDEVDRLLKALNELADRSIASLA